MAFTLIHYSFMFGMICTALCAIVVLQRYFLRRQNIALFFALFLTTYAFACGSYAFRGFSVALDPLDIMLWQLSNYLYVVMTTSIALFMLYPLLQQTRDHRIKSSLWAIVGIIIIVIVFNLSVISIAEIQLIYIDIFGLGHYTLIYLPIPYVYYLTLIFDVIVAHIALVILAISYKRETDTRYKSRALHIFTGLIIVVYGQFTLLHPVLAVFNPLVIVIGTLLITRGVLRS